MSASRVILPSFAHATARLAIEIVKITREALIIQPGLTWLAADRKSVV